MCLPLSPNQLVDTKNEDHKVKIGKMLKTHLAKLAEYFDGSLNIDMRRGSPLIFCRWLVESSLLRGKIVLIDC